MQGANHTHLLLVQCRCFRACSVCCLLGLTVLALERIDRLTLNETN